MKQVIIARKDLKMSPGKLAAQVAHAAVAACYKTRHSVYVNWSNTGMTKIVLSSQSETHLLSLYKAAVAAYLPCSLICDEGVTEVDPGTFTCVAIGPAEDNDINEITGHLGLY